LVLLGIGGRGKREAWGVKKLGNGREKQGLGGGEARIMDSFKSDFSALAGKESGKATW